MAIITQDYFQGEIFIDHAKPDVSDSTTGVSDELNSDIEQYEREILVKSLGYSLFKLFSDELDSNESNGLKVTADPKWDELMNGLEYTIDGKTVNFRGVRFSDEAVPFDDAVRKQSLIAYYVYYFYIRKDIDTYSSAGVNRIKAANSEGVSIMGKATRAWNNFYNLTVGNYCNAKYYYNQYSLSGIDYYGSGNSERSLYEFLRDQNSLTEDKYPNWEPFIFVDQNILGI